ncbi:MAG: ABC transporter ATP-binding protein [Bacillota bacterium]
MKQGDFVAIVGPSGSGKSTLMNVIGCLDSPSEGSYKLDGIEVKGQNDNKLAEIRNRKIGFIFQGFHLLPRLTAFENVELPLIYSGLSAKERKERAAPILLADEPTGALDTKTGQEVLGLIETLNREGHTIVLITHDMDVAKRASRTVIMRDGLISEQRGGRQ